MSVDWNRVREKILEKVDALGERLLYGQDRAARAVAERLPGQPGVILADEVGLGKTRVALLALDAVLECGGSAAAVVPPGLLFQWEGEYKDYKNDLGQKPLTAVKLRSFGDLFDHGEIHCREGDGFPLANGVQARWLLISHAFGFHRITERSPAWRVDLPALVRAAAAFDCPGRNKWREYAKKCNYHKEPIESRDGQYWASARYLAALLKGKKLSLSTSNFLSRGEIRPNTDGSQKCPRSLIKQFRRDAPGYSMMLELIGHIIGSVDLFIIDEAHKSRDEAASPNKQLGILIERIIRQSVNRRRISLTATPIELGAFQWKDILIRTGLNVDDDVIRHFTDSLKEAQRLPQSPEAIERLTKSAKAFESALKPVVIRRRRINQREMKNYFNEELKEANPHRKTRKIPIQFDYLPERWRRSVLALEGQGLSAKGLSELPMRERLMDTRYASGLMSCDVDDGSLDQNNTEDSPQRRRFLFWRKVASTTAGWQSGLTGLMDHPRIQAAADRIECELALVNGDHRNQEKYLVFGRFKAPMVALRNELNARYLLRCIDLERPVPGGRIDHEMIFCCYERLVAIPKDNSHPRNALAFQGILSLQGGSFPTINKNALMDRIKVAVNRHDNDREYVTKILDRQFLRNELPGDAVIKRLSDDQQDALFALLRLDVFAELYHDGGPSALITGSKAAHIKGTAIKIWAGYLEGIIDGMDEDVQEDEGTGWEGDVHYEKLDSFGDRIDPVHLVQSLGLDDQDARESTFCRLLQGDTQPETRKVLQAQFNGMVYPRVLVAQSLVGREGLNLHRKCRRVLLFHPEWNPAVVEQQIGRVDRIGSLWSRMADDWQKNGQEGEIPKILVEYMVFEKTYDEYQFRVLEGRRVSMNAQLFGELLEPETLVRVPADKIEDLLGASPDFEP